MTKLVPFHPVHLSGLTNMLECYEEPQMLVDSILKIYGAPGSYIWTLLSLRGEVVAVFGGLAHLHVANAWAAATKLVKDYPVAYHKALKEIIEYFETELGTIRIQSAVDVDNQPAIRQHLKMGFVNEGVMRKNGPKGQDQILFARVR